MKLILTYSVGELGIAIPIKYPSKEALICAFEAVMDQTICRKHNNESFMFCGIDFYMSDLYDECDRKTFVIYTVDEWFKLYHP